MDPLGQRRMFLEGTNIFGSQKLHSTRNKVVQFLNEIALADNSQKCENIAKVQELILHTEKDLCEEFLQDVLALSQDKNAEVRKTVASFIEEACRVDISLFPKIVDVLSSLLRDATPQVIKKVIQAALLVYKNAIRFLADLTGSLTDEMEQGWNKLCLVKDQILDMLDNSNDGIRTNAIKFLESVIIYQTSRESGIKVENDFSLDDIPATLKIFKRRKAIEDEGLNIFDQLIKFHGASHISSVNLIACTGTLCTIAKLRKSLMVPVVEALKNVHHNLPPTLTDSQVSSVRKHFKMQFLGLLKHTNAIDVQPQLVRMLEDLGCGDEIKRNLPKLDYLQRKRPNDASTTSSSSKRPRREPETVEIAENDPEVAISLNEVFLQEKLTKVENVVQLVVDTLKFLPDQVPQAFIEDYTPFKEKSIEEQILKISKSFATQMVDAQVGPGAQKQNVVLIEKSKDDEETTGGDTAAKRLRETLERVKGLDKNSKPKLKHKTTKTLQEITKPLSKTMKETLLNRTIVRIIKSDQCARLANVGQKHTKILTVFGSTFLPNVKDLVQEYILSDLFKHINVALSWLFEEYSLIQGFVRHSYIKNGPDNAYNGLLVQLLRACQQIDDIKEKKTLIRTLFLFVPMITDDAIKFLEEMCEDPETDLSETAIEIIKDILLRKPPKTNTFLDLLLKLCVSKYSVIREQAVAKVNWIYSNEKHLQTHIEKEARVLLGYLALNEPPEQFRDQDGVALWNEELTKGCLRLTMELLPLCDRLLHDIAEIYVKASSDIKRTILRAIESPVKQLGQNNPELLALIENCVTGSETLITRIIYILTEKVAPSQELVDRVKALHASKVSDVRLLIPIVCGLSKKELLGAMPRFVKLNPVVLKEVFSRLLTAPEDVAPITPTELLVAIHVMDDMQGDIKAMVKATSLCLVDRDAYTHEVLAAVLQQLVDVIPLPTLLMRTVLQALSLYPKLSGFVINLLQRLIQKKVWKQRVVWDGFLKCCQRLMPASFVVLMQLPPAQLEDALKSCPELKEPLSDYARTVSESQIGIVPHHIIKILLGNDDTEKDSATTSAPTQPSPDATENVGPEKTTFEPAPPGME